MIKFTNINNYGILYGFLIKLKIEKICCTIYKNLPTNNKKLLMTKPTNSYDKSLAQVKYFFNFTYLITYR